LFLVSISITTLNYSQIIQNSNNFTSNLNSSINASVTNGTIELNKNQIIGNFDGPVMCIILYVIDLTLAIQSLPYSSISDYGFMLELVTRTYIKTFLMFSMYLISFAIIFMMTFEGPFKEFSLSILKTLTMVVGEFNTSDLVLEEKPVWKLILLFLFVFFMSLVILNLLHGLAVSDVQEIKTKAELDGLIYRVNKLYDYEENLKIFSKCKYSKKNF